MMWGWGSGSGSGWWVVGSVFMVICMVVMMRMMGGMMSHGHWGHGGRSSGSDPERTLADRLARGEIDTEEYEHRLEALLTPSTRREHRELEEPSKGK
jgi:putative membrane protein